MFYRREKNKDIHFFLLFYWFVLMLVLFRRGDVKEGLLPTLLPSAFADAYG